MAKKKENIDWFNMFIANLDYEHEFYYDESIDYKYVYNILCQRFLVADVLSVKRYGRKAAAIKYHKPKTYQDLIDLYQKINLFGRGVTEKALKFCYGDLEGLERWNNYCSKQSETNTFKYKNEKYGMSKSEFDDFNKSRAVTQNNLIKKYGDEEGLIRWKKYCARQAYTNTKDHLGERYEKICRQKAHTYETYLDRFKDPNIAEAKLKEFFVNNGPKFYSKISQKLFTSLTENEFFANKKIYYAELNQEYGFLDKGRNKYYKCDFACTDIKLIIEFYGDHYHGNPKLYHPLDFLKGRGQSQTRAIDAWNRDNEKEFAIRNRGFDIIIIWESDYTSDPEKTIEGIIKYAKNRVC